MDEELRLSCTCGGSEFVTLEILGWGDNGIEDILSVSAVTQSDSLFGRFKDALHILWYGHTNHIWVGLDKDMVAQLDAKLQEILQRSKVQG